VSRPYCVTTTTEAVIDLDDWGLDPDEITSDDLTEIASSLAPGEWEVVSHEGEAL
jgi:hypothetical protein